MLALEKYVSSLCHGPRCLYMHTYGQMEDKLDEIARGQKARVEYLSEYYLGDNGLKVRVQNKTDDIDPLEAKRARLPGLEVSGYPMDTKIGPYIQEFHPSTRTGKKARNKHTQLTWKYDSSTVDQYGATVVLMEEALCVQRVCLIATNSSVL